MKRFFAILAVILLLSLYVLTMIFALSNSPHASGLFKASVFCTIAVPVLLYAFILVYRNLKNRGDK